jgi:hypothetical protein
MSMQALRCFGKMMSGTKTGEAARNSLRDYKWGAASYRELRREAGRGRKRQEEAGAELLLLWKCPLEKVLAGASGALKRKQAGLQMGGASTWLAFPKSWNKVCTRVHST